MTAPTDKAMRAALRFLESQGSDDSDIWLKPIARALDAFAAERVREAAAKVVERYIDVPYAVIPGYVATEIRCVPVPEMPEPGEEKSK